jgi:hypothetical protein
VNWSRSGTTFFRTNTAINTSGWTLRTQDNDENVGAKSIALPAVNLGPGQQIGILMNGFSAGGNPAVPGIIDAASLPPGSSIVTTPPSDLDAGTWAYAMALFDNSFPLPQMQAFFQLRRAGSSATVGGTSELAQAAVNAGLWPSTAAYIEFQSQFAGYASGPAPTGPSSFVGFILPEPSGVGLMMVGAMGLAGGVRRRLATSRCADHRRRP